jgi:Flp pilus assembly protein TadD
MTYSANLPGSSADPWHARALEHLANEQIEDAVRCLRRAVALDPQAAGAWNDLGVVLEALGNRRDAVHCYQQALRARPGMKAAIRNLMALAIQASLAAHTVLPPPVSAQAATAVAR